MSYDIYLKDNNGECFDLKKPLFEGGILEVGGNKKTWLNITYNYSPYYLKYLDSEKGIEWLYGKKARDCIDRLQLAIEPYKNEPRDSYYWKYTEGNAVVPLKVFLEWAKQFPEGIFEGD